MSDIVERLRELDKSKHIGYRVGWRRKAGADCNEAADEIERLRAEVEGLREFVEHVRRNGSTHLANMAVAVLAARKGDA